jgi:hypothetical protein
MSLPHRNRVDPFGEVVADPARGGLFGNRGVLHDRQGEIRRHHRGERWIYCRLDFKGRRRELMQPGQYTELFFLDEPTALAAGHRPCMECMRERAVEFRDAWAHANPALAGKAVRVTAIDAVLHEERLDGSDRKRTYMASVGELPAGAMLLAERLGAAPHLIDSGHLREWTFAGYLDPVAVSPDEVVDVLTPPSTVRAIAAGFAPAWATG